MFILSTKQSFNMSLTKKIFKHYYSLDKSSDDINFKKNTTLVSLTDMFRQFPLSSSV